MIRSFFLLISIFQCFPREIPSIQEPSVNVIDMVKDRTVILHYHISNYAKGTGLLLDDKGHVLTSRHVILGWEERVRISQDSNTFYDAKVIKEEPKLDLVILKTDLRKALPTLKMADRSELSLNQPIFLVGSAWGLGNSFLKGYISNTNREGVDTLMPSVPLIQTMGTSYPGCSGAGVFLYDGSLIGINRATLGDQPGNSVGLVIPSGYVRTFLKLNHISIELP